MPSISSQQKTNNGPRVFVGYINYFSFSPDIDLSVFGEIPKSGDIYRVIEVPNEYRLYLGRTTGSIVDGLILGKTLVGNYLGKWEFDIEELTTDNILNFDLSPEQLRQLDIWKTTQNSDVWDVIQKASQILSISKALEIDRQSKMVDEMQERINTDLKEFLKEVVEGEEAVKRREDEHDDYKLNKIALGADAFNTIVDEDKEMAILICELLIHIADTYKNKSEFNKIHQILINLLKNK